jgi:hypothetical protein
VAVMLKPRQPREARSSTAHMRQTQLVSLGSRPMTLVRRRVSPKVRSINPYEVGVADALPMLTGETQVHGQRLVVVKEAAHRCRERRIVGGGEGPNAVQDKGFGLLAAWYVVRDVGGLRMSEGLVRPGGPAWCGCSTPASRAGMRRR